MTTKFYPKDSVTTQRLIIRRPKPSDGPAITRAINEWEVIRWLSRVPYPYLQSDAIEFIKDSTAAWSTRSGFRFLIEFMGKIVGGIGLEQHHQSTIELGFWITHQHWGKGFATEAIFAISEYGFQKLHVSQITASCDAENDRSRKVLMKTNFSKVGTGLKLSASLEKEVPTIQFLQVRPSKNVSTHL